MSRFACPPLSRKDIRAFAQSIRKQIHLENVLYFPVEYFLEILFSSIDDLDFSFQVVDSAHWLYPLSRHAYFDLKENCIFILDMVYEGACNGCGRDRMTIVHECAHVLLFNRFGLSLSRSFAEKTPVFCDPEWQAKCLAGELMIPYDLVSDYSATEVSHLCGVSLQAASYQLQAGCTGKRKNGQTQPRI